MTTTRIAIPLMALACGPTASQPATPSAAPAEQPQPEVVAPEPPPQPPPQPLEEGSVGESTDPALEPPPVPIDFTSIDGEAVGTPEPSLGSTPQYFRDPDVTPPRMTGAIQCPFPEEAGLDAIETGTVVLCVNVAADGRTRSVFVIQSSGGSFTIAARKCLLAATFTPARARDGSAVDGSATVRVIFRR